MGHYKTDEERDAAMTRVSDVDIAYVREGRWNSGTAQKYKEETYYKEKMDKRRFTKTIGTIFCTWSYWARRYNLSGTTSSVCILT